jgi:O-antigen ligase
MTRRLMSGIAALVLVIAVVRPPEVWPVAAAVVEMLGAAALVLLALRPGALPADARRAALLLLPLAAAAVWLAANRARAFDEAALVGQFILFVALGCAVAAEPWTRRAIPALLLGLGVLAAAQAIAQHHWAWPRVAAELRAAGPPADAGADAMLVRLESGRPSGPFVLPTALAGFLAITIPASLLTALEGGIAARAVAAAALVAQCYALFLTRSLGGLAALACGCVVLMVRGPGRALRRILPAAAVLLAIGIASLVFVRARHGEMTSAPGADPVSLRAGNWRVAAAMIRDHPLFGVGPGSFGTFYPRYMRAGMNETQYAHDSYLQLVSTWGLWVLVPIGASIAAFGSRLRTSGPRDAGRLAAMAGGSAFLVHNLIDFTFYQPGVAVPCALLLGVATAGVATPPADPDTTPSVARGEGAVRARRGGARVALGCAVAALLAIHGVRAARCAMLLERAGAAARRGDLAAAREDAVRASAARPDDPRPWAFLSEMAIVSHGDDPTALRFGRRAAERAVALDPEAAGRHHVLALYHAKSEEPAAAWLEERRAHELFPLKPLYGDAGPEGSVP